MDTTNQRLVLTAHAAKRHSRRLQREMQDLFDRIQSQELNVSNDFSLSQSQDMLARIFGMQNWHEMHQVLGNTIPQVPQLFSDYQEPELLNASNFVSLLVQLSQIKEIDTLVFKTGEVTTAFIGKDIYKIGKHLLLATEMNEIVNTVYPEASEKLYFGDDINLRYQVRLDRNESIKYMVNMSKFTTDNGKGYEITFHKVRNELVPLEIICMDKRLLNYLSRANGLVLVCGPVGSGKTNLLSAVIQDSIRFNSVKVLTYEHPVEYTYDTVGTSSIVTQTEVGIDIPTYAHAIRNALRRQPDIILVGELADREVANMCVQAATNGHCVYTSLYSQSIADTAGALYELFGQNNQSALINFFYNVKLLVNQIMIKGENGQKVFLQEYLPMTDEVLEGLANHCESRFEIKRAMKRLMSEYGVTFEQSAKVALDKDLITQEQYNKVLAMFK